MDNIKEFFIGLFKKKPEQQLSNVIEKQINNITSDEFYPKNKKPPKLEKFEPFSSLELARELKYGKLDMAYKAVMAVPLITKEGYPTRFDDTDILKLGNFIEMIEELNTDKGYLTLADDTTVYNIGTNTLKSVRMQMLIRNNCISGLKQFYKNLIKNAKSIEELDQIEFKWDIDDFDKE